METILCSVPVEAPGTPLRRKRSDGMGSIQPKVAITSLNHWAEKNNFPTCKFYDIDMLYPSDDDVERYFRENNADVVGLSAVVSTSYLQVKRLARIIRKVNKNTFIVCGGYLTAAANTVLRKTEVDVCVVGDGEVAWVGILKFAKEHLETGKNKIEIDKLLKVKGIAILDENEELRFSGYGQRLQNCDMTFPDFEYLKTGLQGKKEDFKNYFRPFKRDSTFLTDSRSYRKDQKPMVTTIFTAKGCVAKCTFCQRGSLGYNTYDLSKLETYIKSLRDNYDVGFLHIDDENFGSDKKYTYQVAELFHKYDMLWDAGGVRCTSVNKEDVIHYKKNGCCSLQFGIESGSQTMLDIMEKKFTVDDIKKAIFACYDNELWSPVGGFMLGMPGETLKTASESGKLLGEIAARRGVPLGIIFGHTDIRYTIPLVGTPLYEYGKQLGLVGQNVDEEEKYLELTSNVAGYKRYYLNFNGAPMSEVIFWDMLFFLEATRTYVKLMKGKTQDKKWTKKLEAALELQGINPHNKAKDKNMVKIMGAAGEMLDVSFSQYFITNFLKQYIIFNKTVAKLPRFLVNPLVRFLLNIEFLIQKYIFKDNHNLFLLKNVKVSSKIRIKYDDVDPLKTTQKERSLRTIVAKRTEPLYKTPEAKLHSALTGGP